MHKALWHINLMAYQALQLSHGRCFGRAVQLCCMQNLLELVSNEMANDNCQKDPGLMAFYTATLSHIASQKVLPDKAVLYEEIQI